MMFKRRHIWQIVATVIIALGLISDGMHFGWSSPAEEYLTGSSSPFIGYNQNIKTANRVLFLVAGVAFTPLISYLVDTIGRKWTNILGSAINLISWVLVATAQHVEVLCLANALASISYTFDMIVIPMYVAEISDKGIRGFLLGYVVMSAMLGIILIYTIFPFVSVFFSSMVGAMLHVLHITIFIFLPESPYFLIKIGKNELGTKALQFFRGVDNVKEELADVNIEIELQNQKKAKFIDIVRDASSRKALFIGSILYFFVPMHALSVITMNLHEILGDDLLVPKNYSEIVFALTLILSQIGCMFVVDKLGRKPLLLFSQISCQVALVAFAMYFAIRDNFPKEMNTPYVTWIAETSIYLYAWCYRFGLGPIPTALCAELFPLNHKAAGMSITFVIMTLTDGLAVFLFERMNPVLGFRYPLFIYAGIGMLSVPFVIFCVPETKNKSLEEIQRLLRNDKRMCVDVKTIS